MHDQLVDAAAGVVEPKRRKVRKTGGRAACREQRGRARGGTLRQSRQSHLGNQGGRVSQRP